jgi:uroporphyrinogen III methyltransferase/synthase
VNGVEHFFRAVADTGGDSRRLGRCRVAAIGDATDEALRARGIVPDLVPPRFTSEALFEALRDAGQIAGRRFLLARTDIAPEGFVERLRTAGGTVTAVTAYRTVPVEPDAAALAALRERRVNVVVFTSASTARNFAATMRAHLGGLPDGVAYVSIGPETTKAACAEGLPVGLEAAPHTIPGLVQAMVERFGGKRA